MNKILRDVISFSKEDIGSLRSAVNYGTGINIIKEAYIKDNENSYLLIFEILKRAKVSQLEIHLSIMVNKKKLYKMKPTFIRQRQRYYESLLGVRKYTLNSINKIDFYIDFKLNKNDFSTEFLMKEDYNIFSNNIYLLKKTEKEEDYILNEITYRNFQNKEELAKCCLMMLFVAFYKMQKLKEEEVEFFIEKLYYVGIDFEDYGEYFIGDFEKTIKNPLTPVDEKIKLLLDKMSLLLVES